MMKKCSASITLLVSFLYSSTPASAQMQSAARIVSNPAIAGRGLLSIFSYFQLWQDVGESEIMLQSDVAKGMRVFSNPNEAQTAFSLSGSVSEGALPAWMNPLIINAYPAIGYQLAIRTVSGPLLREGLTIQSVVNELGVPEQVRDRLVTSDDRDVKPIILREFSYAGGAVTFGVLSDAPDQNTIDVAFLNVPAVAAALFREGAFRKGNYGAFNIKI